MPRKLLYIDLELFLHDILGVQVLPGAQVPPPVADPDTGAAHGALPHGTLGFDHVFC